MKKPETCSIKPNFVKDKDIAVLPANLPEASTIEETLTMLVEYVLNQVNTSYSMNEDESEDPAQLSDAKLDMIRSVIDLLDNYKFANPELTVKKGSDNSKIIEAGLILALDPVSFNKKIDLDVQAVIHPKDSTEELNRRSLDESLSRFFKGYTKNLYKLVMRERLASVTTINLDKKTITTDVVSLNRNIEDFLQLNYLTLIRYMETVGPGVKWGNEKNFPTSMWHNTHNIIKTLDTYLNQFEWYLEFLRRTGELDNLIEEGYNSYVFEDKQNTDFLEAVFSFLTLKYFDPVIRDTVGNQISFNKDLKLPFENGTTKYYYGKDIEGRVQGWGVEARDALKELGNYSKLLISLIKIVDPETKKVIENEEMRPVDYFQTMTLLLRAIPEFIKFTNESRSGSEFDKYIAQNLRNNLLHLSEAPVESMRAIMFRIHEAMQSQYYSRNKSKLMEVLERLFNAHELRILESIYLGVFSTANPKSMYMVERNFIELTGVSYAYPIVETLVAQIVSSTQKDYGQTVWNKDHYERNIKLKFNTDKMMYELVNAMNIQNTQDLSEHPYKLIAKNNFRGNTPDSNKEVYIFDVDGVKIKIEIPTNANTLGLFQKTYKDAKVYIEENKVSFPVLDYFKKIKIDTHRQRRSTVNSNSGVNKNLRTLLKFIDTFTGTSFSNAEDGLQRYSLIRRYEKDALSKMLLTAFKGFYINNINRDFIDAVDSGKYNGMDLDKYIQNEKLIFAKIWDLDLNKPDWKSVWLNTSRGLNLKTANTGVSWISNYSRVQLIMSGEIARSNIKNVERNNIPNYGLSYEGSNIWTLMESDAYKSKVSDNLRVYDALATNPFTSLPDLILASTVDEDIELRSGDTKMVKAMTDSELYYHSIVDKFFLLLSPDKNSKDDRMEIQPTTYSDKTAFINYVVNITKDNLVNKSSKEIETLIINSIGGMYRTILNNVINDYAIVFPLIASIEDINEKIIAIENIIKNMKEGELVNLFSKHNLKLEVDTHFRKINGGKLAFNELLVLYALDTYTNKGLHARLELEKKTMIRNLLESLTTFSLKGEGNPIQGIYNRFIGNDKTWINGENRLILAKDESFREITSILLLERASTIYMNPLLEKFFMLHTYLGNNLRYILSGNELDHKNKMLSKLNLGDRILNATYEQLSKLSKDSLLAKYPELESKLTENEDGTYTLQKITLSDLMKMNPGLQEALLDRVVATNSKQYDAPIQTLSTYWKSLSFADLDYLMNTVPTLQNPLIKKVKADAIYEVEATSLGAQLKRNVIIPGTMRTYTLGSLKGIPSTFRVAVVDDVAAETFNVNGDVKPDNDAHDGSAWICPITSILENWSLQENEVGTVKKPIWHDYNGALGTAVLVKFAAHTITNNVMRKAHDGINMYNVFKKMTNNNRWDGMFTDSILNHDDFSQEVITMGKLTGDNQLMYKGKEGRIYVINEIGYENGTYFTLEAEVDPSNGTVDSNQKVYHYFDENSNHIKSNTLINNPAYHLMGSLFEAYQVFGGLNSGYVEGKQFHYSEASLYATAMLTNLVTVANTALIESEKALFEQDLDKYYAGKTSGKPTYTIGQDQKHYSQPLKLLMVDYIVNNSAIKNGAGNRNSSDRLYNNEKFDTIVLHNQYYGILMDSDHEADEAEMTEFSQVISALDAGGRLHGYVKDIYYALGDMAIRESLNEHSIIKEFQDAIGINDKADYINEFKKELNIPLTTNIELLFEKALELREDQVETLFSHEFSNIDKAKILPAFKKAVKQYNQLVDNARDQLYTIIGDVLIDNIAKRSNLAGLTDAILREIKSKFSLKSSHKLDSELKIPFSDPNVYSSILSNFASLITKKSIRRSYPGIGGVLSPGYDIMMVYDLNGKTYQYDDILLEAIEYYNEEINLDEEELEDETEEKKALVNSYKAVLDNIQDDSTWNQELIRLYLELKRDEYNKDQYYYDIEADSTKNGIDLTNSLPDWEYYTETFMPTDRIGIRYTDSNDNEFWEDINLDDIEAYYNFKKDPRAFLLDRLSKRGLTLVTIRGFRKNINKARNLAPSKVWWTYTDVAGRARTKNIYDTEEVKNAFLNKDNSKVQSILDLLDTGEWNGYKITLFNEPAELIMSNIYLTRFNVDADTSLVDILNNKRRTFKDKPIQQTTGIVDRDFYDFIMLKNNGKHSYISFNRSFENQEGIDDKFYKRLSWGRKQRKPTKSANKNIVSDVYVLDDDRRPMFMIGRDVVRDNIKYDKTKDEFYTQEEGKDRVVIKNTNLTWDGNKVTEYVEFVTQHLYKKSAIVDNNDITKNHQVFNIDTKKFKDAFGKVDNDEKEALYYDELREILKSIYLSDSYECLTLNDKLYSVTNSNMIRKIMSELHTKFTYDSNLSNFLHDVYEQVIKDRMITPTKKDGKWHFEITGKEKHLGLIHKKGTDAVLVGSTGYANSMATLTRNYYKSLMKRKLTSFLRSLRYTASRIPAQTLQSFMLMKLVGFTGEKENYTYVSHWQTWLQGSDYDIDKAYIMGLAFDDNGSYVGWSNLFDYTDIDTLTASEKLPLPRTALKITEAANGVDINEELSQLSPIIERLHNPKSYKPNPESLELFNEKQDRLDRINLYLKIFEKLGENTIIKTVDDSNRNALLELMSHYNTQYPPGRQSLILRNFISSHILNSILHIRNLKDSYIPVEMEDLRAAAENSPKGLDAKTITLVNPMSVYKMQRQNMIGKNVIGIAATGQKAAFMLSYYMNEVYKNAKLGIDYNIIDNPDGTRTLQIIPGSKLAEALFEFTSSRLVHTPDNTVRVVPDLNLENVIDELKLYALANKLNPKNPVDIMISQLISAATDNAKELILDKINAGDNLAKCFLFGIVVGCNVSDLVKFMTSPVLSWISTLSNTNIYTDRELTVDRAIEKVKNFLENRLAVITKALGATPTSSILQAIIPEDLTADQIGRYLEDIAEFKNLLEAANEFSSLGRVLSVNLGIQTKAEELEVVTNNIQRIIASREEELGMVDRKSGFSRDTFNSIIGEDKYERYETVISSNFDPVRWLQNRNITLKTGEVINYRLLTAEYYNFIKKTFNVFGVINTLPHFREMFTLMGDVFSVHQFSTRTRIVLEAVRQYKDLNPGKYLDQAGYSLILGAANDMMLIKFFEETHLKFPVKKGYPLIRPDGSIYIVKDSTKNIDLADDAGRAKFKYLFDNYIVPKLKAGTFFTPDMIDNSRGNLTELELQAKCDEYNRITSTNEFITSLMKGTDNDIPIWKTDIDMASDTSYSLLRIAKFGRGLMQLHSLKIGDKYSVADWFSIYNFITNKNQYGSDRLTKAFESFVTTFNGKRPSIIGDYFKFVGNIDYKGKNVLEYFDVSIYDMLMQSARVVNNLDFAKGLMVVKDLEYYIKQGSYRGSYKKFGKVIQTDDSLTLKLLMDKYLTRRSYYVLSKPYTDFVNRIKYLLDNEGSAYKALAFLMLRKDLHLEIDCK